jgi:8-oxo-dGTP pyrophosphatase MutT (NUDIX family)
MNFETVIEKLQSNIHFLPGEEAHRLCAPRKRLSTKDYLSQNPSYKTSCVAVILYPDNGAARLLLMERPDGPFAHGGQISFPGGKREQDDATLLDTAMREMYEEVGISPSEITVLGPLSELYIPVSNFLVHPFICYTSTIPLILPNPAEVKSILTPEIISFDLKEIPVDRFESRSFGWIEAPYFPVEQHRIWGATAMIISELMQLIKK